MQEKINPLTKALRFSYLSAGILAAISLVVIMLLVLAQIIARQFGSHIPSSGDVIGFLVVWASFLGLAYTMHHQQHIRVELLIGRLSKQPRHWLNVVIGGLAFIVLLTFSYYVFSLIYESIVYNDQTDGEVAMPLWLVQLPMGIGCALFCLSMLDFTVTQLRKKARVMEIDVLTED
ncbi:MAG: C4-dicarboxylate ABC transporter permease [Gammaproteobacteria bacterium]|nr:MAG: C4-dicarboxylate ABC transporter permease [Gammaproteobacteria bacterium]